MRLRTAFFCTGLVAGVAGSGACADRSAYQHTSPYYGDAAQASGGGISRPVPEPYYPPTLPGDYVDNYQGGAGPYFEGDPLWYDEPTLLVPPSASAGQRARLDAERRRLAQERARLAAERRRLAEERDRINRDHPRPDPAPPRTGTPKPTPPGVRINPTPPVPPSPWQGQRPTTRGTR